MGARGALPVFGYPLTAQRGEESRDTGQTYETQWFERNLFELHPENSAPYDVLLGRLGDDALKLQGRDWQAEGREAGPQPGCLWFEQTGHNVCNQDGNLGFRTYWETHGLNDPRLSPFARSLALFGLPLTAPRNETNSSGDRVLTQWFERARFEWHPDNPAEFKVLLGRLGAEIDGGVGPVLPPHQGSQIDFSTPSQQADGLLHSFGSLTNPQGQTLTVELAGHSGAALSEFGAQASFSFNFGPATNARPVFAMYNPGFELAEWDTRANERSDTPKQRYSGGDPATIERHVTQAIEAGLDGFVCKFDTPEESVRCGNLLDRAAQDGLQVVLSPDMSLAGVSDPNEVVSAIDFVATNYMTRAGWARYNGKPLLLLTGPSVETFDVTTWREIKQRTDPNGDWFWLGQYDSAELKPGATPDFNYLDVFDALYGYNFRNTPLADALRTYDDALAAYNRARRQQSNCSRVWAGLRSRFRARSRQRSVLPPIMGDRQQLPAGHVSAGQLQ